MSAVAFCKITLTQVRIIILTRTEPSFWKWKQLHHYFVVIVVDWSLSAMMSVEFDCDSEFIQCSNDWRLMLWPVSVLQLLSLVSLATWFNILISATVTRGWLSCALHVGVSAEWSFQLDASRVERWLATNGRLTSPCCRRTTQKGTYHSLLVTSSICFL